MSVQLHPRAPALDQAAPDGLQASPPPVSKWRLAVVLWLLGMPGVVAVVWALLPLL